MNYAVGWESNFPVRRLFFCACKNDIEIFMMYAILYISRYRREKPMIATNVTTFRNNIFSLLEQTIKYNEPLNVSTKSGNVVVLSEEDYRGLTETLSLSSVPGMKEKLLDGKNTPLSDCVPESEVAW